MYNLKSFFRLPYEFAHNEDTSPMWKLYLKEPIGSDLEFFCVLFGAKYEELGLFEVRQLVEASVGRKSKLRNQTVTCALASFGFKI